MAGSNEEELEEVISSFRRIWRSGGRASLSLHANQGELEVGLFLDALASLKTMLVIK